MLWYTAWGAQAHPTLRVEHTEIWGRAPTLFNDKSLACSTHALLRVQLLLFLGTLYVRILELQRDWRQQHASVTDATNRLPWTTLGPF